MDTSTQTGQETVNVTPEYGGIWCPQCAGSTDTDTGEMIHAVDCGETDAPAGWTPGK